MSKVRMPDLESLKYFEAAARLGSYTAAATELFVSQAAVSQQIRNIETRIGVKLFVRQGRNMVLSDEGRLVYPDIIDGLDLLQNAFRKLALYQQPNVISVTMLPSFASRWLVPRLWRFNHQYPEIELRLSPNMASIDMLRSDMDMAIRLGEGRYPGLESEWLMDDYAYAVASPKIAEQIKEPKDVAKFLLIHGWVQSGMNWDNWFKQAGLNLQARNLKQSVIDESGVKIDMLFSDMGVAIVRHTLAKDLVETGKLVRLFDIRISSKFNYYLVNKPDRANSEALNKFKHWLKSEAEKFTIYNAT